MQLDAVLPPGQASLGEATQATPVESAAPHAIDVRTRVTSDGLLNDGQ